MLLAGRLAGGRRQKRIAAISKCQAAGGLNPRGSAPTHRPANLRFFSLSPAGLARRTSALMVLWSGRNCGQWRRDSISGRLFISRRPNAYVMRASRDLSSRGARSGIARYRRPASRRPSRDHYALGGRSRSIRQLARAPVLAAGKQFPAAIVKPACPRDSPPVHRPAPSRRTAENRRHTCPAANNMPSALV